MGNIALWLKLIKSSLIIQWRFTLLSVCLVSFCTTALLIMRRYEVVLSEAANQKYCMIFMVSQLVLVVVLTTGIWRITKSKTLGYISSLKALVIIGVGKKDILLCLVVDILLVTVLSLWFGIHCAFILPLSGSHEMLITPIEVIVMLVGVIGFSCFAVMYFFNR